MSVFDSPFNQVFRNPFGSPFNGGASGGVAWTPALWFLASEQGIWLDPSDFTRYMADKGPELSEDVNFDDTSKWNKGSGWSVTGGQAVHNGASADYINSWFAPEVGKTYEYVVDVAEVPAGSNVQVYVNGVPGPAWTAPGVYRAAVFCANPPTAAIKHSVRASNNTGGTTRLNSFSFKEVTSAPTATLFQDSTGLTPVTAVEQSVGLVLDKRLGLVLGPEDITNGGFDDASGWTTGASWSIAGGNLTATAVASGSNTGRVGDLTAGEWYKATIVITSMTSGGLKLSIGGTDSTTILSAGTYSFILKAANTNVSIQAQGVSTFVVASVSAKALPGNHATQATTASKPKLSARKNWLTKSEDQASATWGKNSVTGSANFANASDGTLTADKIIATATTATHQIYINAAPIPVTTGKAWTGSIELKAAGMGFCYVELSSGVTNGFCVNLTTGEVTNISGAGLLAYTVEDKGNGWWRVSATANTASTSIYLQVYLRDVAGPAGAVLGNGVDGVLMSRAQLEPSSSVSTYQRVNTATDYDSVDFPHYLAFDGVDDFLSTGNIDFTSTDKMTEVLGISVNNGTFGVIHELSATLASNAGAFGRFSGVVSSRHYPTVIRGSAAVAGYAGMVSSTQPDLCVLSATHDIAGDLTRARRNGVYGVDETTDKGTGNLGNYPLYIGRRAGTSSPANMNLYQFVLRGAATTDLAPGEAHAAAKTGITL